MEQVPSWKGDKKFMFFFKQNYEQIQEIQHMLEKCNLNIKDLSETLDLNEKDLNSCNARNQES